MQIIVLIKKERPPKYGWKNIMNTVEQLQKAFEEFLAENQKFVEKGNKAAAGRARKALMEIAKLAKARRAEILEEKK